MKQLGQRLYKAWRIAATGFCFLLFGAGSLILGLLLLILLTPLPVKRAAKQRFTRRVIHWTARCYITTLRALRLISFSASPAPRPAGKGQLLVANHPTLLDAIILMALIPDLICLVKGAMANNPLTWALVNLAGYISNQRDAESVLQQAAARLKQGHTLLIFPEGTRTRDLNQLQFKRGAANIALAAQCSIQAVGIDCTPITLRKGAPWYAVPEQRPHFRVHWLDAVEPSQCVNKELPSGIQARRLTQYLLTLFDEQLRSLAGPDIMLGQHRPS